MNETTSSNAQLVTSDPTKEKWYRYEDKAYSSMWDEDSPYSPLPPTIKVELQVYDVLKVTPCGVWLDVGFHLLSGKRFVKKDSRKMFAHPTKGAALISFRARKKSQIRILKAQLERAERALQKAEAGRTENEEGKLELVLV